MRKWYVGDQWDNFSEHNTAIEAGKAADEVVAAGHEGVYILFLTIEEFRAFCKTGRHTVGLHTCSKM